MTQADILRIVAVWAAVLLVLGAVTACSAGADESVEVVTTSDPLAGELSPLISRWRSSVAEHDDKRIVDYALPEFRDTISRDLGSDASTLNKALYSGATALAPFFKRPLQWTLLRHPEFENAGRGTTVCYYDPAVLAATKLDAGAGLIRVRDPHAVRCFFLFFADSRWFVSFAFAYDD